MFPEPAAFDNAESGAEVGHFEGLEGFFSLTKVTMVLNSLLWPKAAESMRICSSLQSSWMTFDTRNFSRKLSWSVNLGKLEILHSLKFVQDSSFLKIWCVYDPKPFQFGPFHFRSISGPLLVLFRTFSGPFQVHFRSILGPF